MPQKTAVLNPVYDSAECLEILRLAAAVSAFIPLYGGGKDFPRLDPFAPAGAAPIQDTVPQDAALAEPVLPSLLLHRWPAGWTAGIVKKFPIQPTWRHSIACSIGPSEIKIDGKDYLFPSFSNQCLLAYNKERDVYCLAFRGTMTPGNVLEDLLALPVSAGPANFLAEYKKLPAEWKKIGIPLMHGVDELLDLILPHWVDEGIEDIEAWAKRVAAAIAEKLPKPLRWLPLKALERIIHGLVESERSYVLPGIPGVTERACVHAGFRIALESFDFAPSPLALPGFRHPSLGDLASLPGAFDCHTLSDMLQHLADQAKGKPVKLYVTGHSLGAGIATLAAAWLKTQPFKGATFDVKLYAFAQPKPGNEYFSYAMAAAFGNQGAYAVLNSLDSVPQVGMTVQNLQSLNYPPCIQFLLNGLGAAGKAIKEFFSLLPPWNYVHAGQVVLLAGCPVLPGAILSDDGNGFYNLPAVSGEGKNAVYKYPAYLFASASAHTPDDAMPPESAWTLSPYEESAAQGSPALFQALWQHMPWLYMQALLREQKHRRH